jgi:hypothetical protein
MVIAPPTGHGEVQLVLAATFKSPAIVLHRPLEHVERMGGGNDLIEMG